MPSPASTNPLPSSGSTCAHAGENGAQIGGETMQIGCVDLRHFMCSPGGRSTDTEDDPPATTTADASASSSTSALIASVSAPTASTPPVDGSSVAEALPHAATVASSQPQSDPAAEETLPTAPPVAQPDQPAGSSAAGTGAPDSVAMSIAAATRPVTRLQQGISRPKQYNDGTVCWAMHAGTSTDEPSTLKEALDSKEWCVAMDCEYQSLLKNKTWHLVPRPKGKNVVGCKWVYKIKRYGIDYEETFSPVVKAATV